MISKAHWVPVRLLVTCKILMKRCSVISTFVCSLVVALTVGLSSVRGEEVNEGRPNVVFIAVDDMNDWIGCLNAVPHALTPNIDRLAQRGVNFTNAHTAGVFCAPSRAAIFSGQYASTTGCYRTATYFVDHPEIESLQSGFHDAGYKTLGAGKLFHHPAGMIDQRGWSEYFLRSAAQRKSGWPMDSWASGTPFPEPFPNSSYNAGQEITGGLFLEWGAIPDDRESEMADTMRTQWVVDQLKKEHDQPFFLALGLYAPHFPNYCPKKYFDLYDPKKIDLPEYLENDLDDLPEQIRKIKTARSRIHQKLVSIGAVQDAIHGYLASISYADAMVGRVMEALDSSAYAQNTIVVFWSDHGYHHGEKGDWGKHTLWERTSNVPFIWAGPKIASGEEIDSTVSLIDLYPTLVDLCGLESPKQKLEGVSLKEVLLDPTSAKDRSVFLPHMNPGEYAVINRKWRYICYGDKGEELYDVQTDPNEWHNLANGNSYDSVKEELRKTAPLEFAPASPNLNPRRDLVVEDDTFHWERGKGNYQPPVKHLPYTSAKVEGAALAVASRGSRTKRKNILFVVCDDLNTHVSTSGYDAAITPTLRSLSEQSMTFNRAYCQYPVCGPSRASFLSGLYPEATGVLDNQIDLSETKPDLITMPSFFRANGYWTASTGKVFHNEKLDPGERVWNQVVRYSNDELPIVRQARLKFEAENGSVDLRENQRDWRQLSKEIAAPLNAQTPPGHGVSGLRDDQHKDAKNAVQVMEWLKEKPFGEKPFFIALGLQKPHVPFLAPEKYFNMHPRQDIEFFSDRENLWDSIPRSAISNRFGAFGFELGVENPELRREYMQAYHACVSFIDTQLGRVLQALREGGYWEDTVIVFTSDHGYHLGDHFLWGKVTLFDIGSRVPFLIRVPGVTQSGRSSEAMVELVDLYPTLADVSGLIPPQHLQGVSLRPLLGHAERLGKKRVAYTVVRRGNKLGYAIRDQRWRYAKWPDGEELYHLVKDPHERNNLAGMEHVESRIREYRSLLKEKQESIAITDERRSTAEGN